MSDPSTLWNVPAVSSSAPPDVTGRIAQQVSTNPSYQKMTNPGQASFGPASFIATPGPAIGAAIPLAAAAAPFAPAAGLAYGIGKLVAPKWTDETVGKIRDFIGQKIQQAEPAASAYEMGMAESLPGSRFLERKLSQPVQDYLSQIKSQHPDFATAGRIAGTAGQFALPAGPVAGLIKGAGVIPAAVRGALISAPYAIGQGLDVGAQTGDVGKAIESGLLSEALGTAIPAGASWLSKIPAVQRFLTRTQLTGAGIRTSDEVKNLRSYGKSLGLSGGRLDSYVASQAQPLQEKVAGLVDQFGSGRSGKQAMRDWNDAGFDAHNSVYEAITGNHVTTDIGAAGGMSDADHVLADPDLARAVKGRFSPEEVQSAVQDMGNKIDGESWNDARNTILPAYTRAGQNFKGNLAADDPRILKGAVADAWRDHIDSIADRSMAWAKTGELGPEAQVAAKDVPDLHVLKSTYPAIQSIKKAQARMEPALPTNFAPGSDTFARFATNAALQGGGSAVGGLVGGPVGALAGHLAGPIIARVAGKGIEKGAGKLAGILKAGEMAPGLSRAEADLPSLANSNIGAIPASGRTLGQAAAAPQVQPIPIPPAGLPPAGAQPIPNAPMPQPGPVAPVGGPPPGVQPIPLAAPQMSPQDQAQVQFKQAARPQSGPSAFSESQIQARIDEKYARYVQQFGTRISRQDYEKAFRGATNNLDPMLPNTWKAMVDDPETSDRLFKANLNMQKIGNIDPDVALNYYRRLIHVGPRIPLEERQQETQQHDILVQALHDMTGEDLKTVDKRLQQIAFEGDSEKRRKSLMDMIIKEGGVDVPLLSQMGLWHGND